MSQLHLVLALLSLCIRLTASQPAVPPAIFVLNCDAYPGPCNNKCYAIYVAGKPSQEAGADPNPCCGKIAAPPSCHEPNTNNQVPCSSPDEYPYAATSKGGRTSGSSILRCTGELENKQEGGDFGATISRARNKPGFGGTGGCDRTAPCDIQLDVAHYSTVGREAPYCQNAGGANDGFQWEYIGAYQPARRDGTTEHHQWKRHEPDPDIFMPLHQRREFLLDNGERIVIMTRDMEMSYDRAEVLTSGNRTHQVVRELLGSQKSERYRHPKHDPLPANRPRELAVSARRSPEDSFPPHRFPQNRSTAANVESPTQQNLEISPPIPIFDLSSRYIRRAAAALAAQWKKAHPGSRRRDLVPRAGPETCSPTQPCADGSCCGKSGICGYGPMYCGAGNCTWNCDAKAMCGRYSDEGGTISCGMKTCCSYYGWCGITEDHCGNPDPHGLTPCQQGFGSCQIVPPPSCPAGGGSTNGRAIGYYLASNLFNRVCNKISPSQIVTDGLTHLYYAFAVFDPTTFQVPLTPSNPAEVGLYKEFTALQSRWVKTWIAVGGFDFSDNSTSTFHAWSNMVSTSANRAAFISSLVTFMSKYGFQGVDLDWEYPGTPDRGGVRADTANFVALVKEMRAAFGTRFGISLTLAPDYWYLRWFDAIAMQSSVDWFGFMAYDLHGFWDADVKTLGALIRGQTDIRDINTDTRPLWFDGLNPSKINFGLAYYGRGYTVADPGCTTLLCPFSGPSKPGPCTNFAGVLSLREIQEIIADRKLQPKLLPEAMMKQITWADQWIGYDDAETIAMKKSWADSLCFGGTMVWSVDYNSGVGSGDQPANTTDGTCGPTNGGKVCGDWPSGSCCSAHGFCGSGPNYCGSGCSSGDCTSGGLTTDGTCGAQNSNAYCGDWPQGSCCSSAGFCGSDSAHCGAGCQSGLCDGIPALGSGPVEISPDIWNEPNPTVSCYPPCTFVLPPFPLGTTQVFSEPPISFSLTIGGSLTTTVYTAATIPPLTANSVSIYEVPWVNTATTVIFGVPSIVFPAATLTVGGVAPGSSSTSGAAIWTYSPGPYAATPSNTPPPISSRPIYVTTGRPGPTCAPGQNCGHPCTNNCGPPCRLCGPGLPPISISIPCIGSKCCIGPGCNNPGGGGGGGGGGGDNPNNSGEPTSTRPCTTKTTTNYWQSCTYFDSTSTSCTTTSSSVATGCYPSGQDVATTRAPYCPWIMDPSDENDTGYLPDDDPGAVHGVTGPGGAFPYQFTDVSSNVIACQTSYTDSIGLINCAGARTTISTAPPGPPKTSTGNSGTTPPITTPPTSTQPTTGPLTTAPPTTKPPAPNPTAALVQFWESAGCSGRSTIITVEDPGALACVTAGGTYSAINHVVFPTSWEHPWMLLFQPAQSPNGECWADDGIDEACHSFNDCYNLRFGVNNVAATSEGFCNNSLNPTNKRRRAAPTGALFR